MRRTAPTLLTLQGQLKTNRQGFTTAQQWDPSLPCFDPGDLANELAKAAQSKKDR